MCFGFFIFYQPYIFLLEGLRIMYPLLKKMGNIFRIIKELLHAQSVSILRITRLEKNYVFLIKCKIIHFVKKMWKTELKMLQTSIFQAIIVIVVITKIGTEIPKKFHEKNAEYIIIGNLNINSIRNYFLFVAIHNLQ